MQKGKYSYLFNFLVYQKFYSIEFICLKSFSKNNIVENIYLKKSLMLLSFRLSELSTSKHMPLSLHHLQTEVKRYKRCNITSGDGGGGGYEGPWGR